MALKVGTPYDIHLQEEELELDFEYQSEDEKEEKYVLLFLASLLLLYKRYENQKISYVLEHIEKDTKTLQKDIITHTKHLKGVSIQTSQSVLENAGILPENLDKISLNHDKWLKYVFLEQKQTIKGITQELANNLKSKAYYLKSRESSNFFSVRSGFNRAVGRLKQMAQSGYQLTKNKTIRQTQIFLYSDPQAYWTTRGDPKVCMYCKAIESEGPLPLSRLPYPPLHNNCRCHIQLEKDLDLTMEAVKLTYYQI